MVNINFDLKGDEVTALAESVKDSMDSLKDSFSVFSDAEMPARAYELSVLAKLYNALPKEEKVVTATNENDQFENTY